MPNNPKLGPSLTYLSREADGALDGATLVCGRFGRRARGGAKKVALELAAMVEGRVEKEVGAGGCRRRRGAPHTPPS